jgi:peptide/nickel transport system permease protein
VALLVVSTLLTWVLGNLLGGLAGYYRKSRALRLAGLLAMAFHPIPYYIVAFLLLIVFGYLWPVLPISGGSTMNLAQEWSWPFLASLASHAILPVASLALVGLGGWFMGMRSLVSNVVTEDYVAYAELAGVERKRLLASYVMRNALVPQVTGLAMSLGSIFNGAIITEQVFGYPGVGTLLISAVHAGDYSLVLGLTSVSIVAVSVAVLLLDVLYPFLDPRVKL